MADYSSLDIRQRSASTETPPEIRRQVEVAKLIDVSKCIGCKACQSGLRGVERPARRHRHQSRCLRQPHDSRRSRGPDAVHRVREPGDPEPRMADPQGRCMHCTEPGCLKACRPRRDRAVLQRHRRLHRGELHRLRLLREGLPPSTSRCISPDRPQGLQVHPGARTGSAWGRLRPAPRPANRLDHVRHQQAMIEQAETRVVDLKSRGFQHAGLYATGRGRRHARHVRAAPCRPAESLCRPAERPEDLAAGGLLEGRRQGVGHRRDGLIAAVAGFFHYVTAGPQRGRADEEEEAVEYDEAKPPREWRRRGAAALRRSGPLKWPGDATAPFPCGREVG